MDKVSIGRKIRAARQRLGLSQAEFTERIGTSKKTLSSRERGAYLVDVIMLNSIASVSGLILSFSQCKLKASAIKPIII